MSRQFEYTALPDGTVRPLVDVEIGPRELQVKALFDTGSIHTVFHSWVADEAGIDLAASTERILGIGGNGLVTRFTTVRLRAAGHEWEALVGFADQWQPDWGLLGHEAFHRYFVAVVEAADELLRLMPIDR